MQISTVCALKFLISTARFCVGFRFPAVLVVRLQRYTAARLGRFNDEELTDIHIVYGSLHAMEERHNGSMQPHHSTFAFIHKCLRESGSFRVRMEGMLGILS